MAWPSAILCAMPSSTSGLSVRNLSCVTLSGICLHVSPGEVVCLSGPSGSGKSRLLRAIADLDAHGGEAWLDGQAQSATRASDWRRRVMLVPAEAPWWFERIRDHFANAPSPSELERVGLPADALDWPVARLSSGERQRAALLRALSHAPCALLLDEPTANLDAGTTWKVEAWLRERIAIRRLPTLWVAHDMAQVARVGHRHLHISGGRIEALPCR